MHKYSATARTLIAATAGATLLSLTIDAIAGFRKATPAPGRNAAQVTLCQGDYWVWKNPFRVKSSHETRILSVTGRSAQAYPDIGTDGSLDVRADLGGAFTPTVTGDTTVEFEVVDFSGNVTGKATLTVHVISTVPPCRPVPNIGGK